MGEMNGSAVIEDWTVPFRTLLATLIILPLLFFGSAFAGEEESAGAEPEKQEEGRQASADDSRKEKVRVYTNEDLKKYKGKTRKRKGRIVSTFKALPLPGDIPPAGAITEQEKQRRTAALNREIEKAEARIVFIDQRLKSIQNPFLPRTQVKEDEKQLEAGMDARQISEKLKAERASLQERLAQYRIDLKLLAATPILPASQQAAGIASGSPQPKP
jgi:hypothetical protein